MSMAADFARRGLHLLSFVGDGAFGDVYHVKDGRGCSLVVKRSKVPVRRSGALEEYLGMCGLCSPHVVTVRDCWIDGEGRVCILMDYCDIGDLESYLATHYPLTEELLLSILAQLLLGLDHLHKRNRVHRDVKPANILLSSARGGAAAWPVAKLADFGLTRRLSHYGERAVSRIGTPLYLAPEMVQGYAYTSKADVWSLGVVAYRLMTNAAPYPATSVVSHASRVPCTRPRHPSTGTHYTAALGDCVLAMLSWNWKRRPSADTVLRCHVFRSALRDRRWLAAPPRTSPCLQVRVRGTPALVARAAPSESAAEVCLLCFGDQIYVSPPRIVHDRWGGAWLSVVEPFVGFVCAAESTLLNLDPYAGDERFSPSEADAFLTGSEPFEGGAGAKPQSGRGGCSGWAS